jgi:hypothetical protein
VTETYIVITGSTAVPEDKVVDCVAVVSDRDFLAAVLGLVALEHVGRAVK